MKKQGRRRWVEVGIDLHGVLRGGVWDVKGCNGTPFENFFCEVDQHSLIYFAENLCTWTIKDKYHSINCRLF